MKRPLAAGEQPNPRQCNGNTVGLVGRLGQPHRFFSHNPSLGKVPQFGQAPDCMTTGDHGGQGLAEARRVQLAGEGPQHPPRGL
jgi:hypothetical protein